MYLDKMPTLQQDTFVLPSSRIYLFLKDCFLEGCAWLIIFINDVTHEWNGGLPLFMEFFKV